MMTMTCLIGVCVCSSPWYGGTCGPAASAGLRENCPSASRLTPRRKPCKRRDVRLLPIRCFSFVGLVGRLGRTCGVRRLDSDPSHHAAVLMLQDVAVIDKGGDDVRLGK